MPNTLYAPLPLKELDHPARPSTNTHNHQTNGHLSGIKERFRNYSATIEALIEAVSNPIKPHLNKFARFLLVSTFLEDSLRIANQFREQKDYLIEDQGYHDWFVIGFLGASIFFMVLCSILIIFKKWPMFSVIGLVSVIISQGWVYDLITDGTFVSLNLSIMGALMLALSDTLVGPGVSGGRRAIAGVPDISDDLALRRQTYLRLAGRLLLVIFFVGHAFASYLELATESFNLFNIIAATFAALACLLVAVGFKATWSALFLVILTSVVNVLSNNWWSKPQDHPERDFRRFDFFQALSVVGGMILLINQGPGGISFDAKQKSI